MTDEEWKDNVNLLVQKNGGWFVAHGPEDYKVGQIIPISTVAGTIFNAVVVAPATVEDARSDVEFLGFTWKGQHWPQYVKVMVD
jgi:hypothetical protein